MRNYFIQRVAIRVDGIRAVEGVSEIRIFGIVLGADAACIAALIGSWFHPSSWNVLFFGPRSRG